MPFSPDWSLVATDMQGVVLGEITNASDRTFTLPLNRIPTLSFRVPLWHALATRLLQGQVLIKAYRKGTTEGSPRLVFNGIVLSCEENGAAGAQSLAVSCVGPFWRLTKRIVNQAKTGLTIPASGIKDLGLIARDILVLANAYGGFGGTYGYTGIDNGSYVATADGSYGPMWTKNAAEAIAELAAGLNSFDYEVAPTEPTNVAKSFPRIGLFNIAPIIGVQRPDAVFEYGTTRANVVSYTRSVNREVLLNRAIVSLPGWPDGVTSAQNLRFASDGASILANGLYEDMVSDAGVIEDTYRDRIAADHVLYRRDGRSIITFRPATNARPYPYVDYNVGDWVRCRAVVKNNDTGGTSIRFDAMFRIWGATFTLDQNGNESIDLQLVQE